MSCSQSCGGGKKSPRRIPRSASHRPFQLCVERSPRPIPQESWDNNHVEYTYGNLRMPTSGRVSTPGPYGFPNQFDTFGSQIEYHSNWMPKDMNLSEFLEQTATSSRPRRVDQNIILAPSTLPPQPKTLDDNPQFLLQQSALTDQSNPMIEEERRESLMEWFDRSVEKELRKHKDSSSASRYIPQQDAREVELTYSKAMLDRIAGASASQIEMTFDLGKEPDTDLTEAVDKLAKAEAMCKFAGAVKAAEAAAQSAPPELAEEAAASGARDYVIDIQATQFQEELHGVKPMEVISYIGVTKPKHPIKKK